MKTMNIKHKAMASLAIVVSMFSFAAPAMANNHGDTGWSATTSGWNTVDTPNRQKQDASSGYIRTQYANKTVRAWMLGYHNEDVSSATVYMTSGQARKVSNFTYERYGRKQVHMRTQSNSGNGYTGYGVWSPDSV